MSLHDALVYVVTEHLTKFLEIKPLVNAVMSTLDTDEKLFVYLRDEKKIKKSITALMDSYDFKPKTRSISKRLEVISAIEEEMRNFLC